MTASSNSWNTSPASAAIAEMEQRWHGGDRPLAEEVLARHPDLAERPSAVLRVVHEEFRLRHHHGCPVEREDFFRRFPAHRRQLELLLASHPTRRDPRAGMIGVPAAGERLGEFELLAELGQGAEGRVFLARQTSLAGRPVVLKVTPGSGQEHLSLARLQHTNIVPLYSAQQAGEGLRALVMPYFGGTTLAHVLEALRRVPLGERTGRHLLDVLDNANADSPIRCPSQGPARHLLARASYVQALCWIGAGLADGLEYAHQRGLVHLDVKPSNVLLANDGTPMLLDFHLARPPVRRGELLTAGIGGTPAFMPDEQYEAMESVHENAPAPQSLDGRADQFALAAALYHTLGGSLPVLPRVSPPLHKINPHVSLGLSDIIQRALAREPKDRYADAASFAADLRRHLGDQPLAGVANRSWPERWWKWRRRKPYSFGLTMMLLALLGAALAVGFSLWNHLGQQKDLAGAALDEGRELLAAGKPVEAGQAFQRGRLLLNGTPFAQLRDELDSQERQAEEAAAVQQRKELAAELHHLVERVRFLHGSRRIPEKIAERCAALWQRRNQVLESLGESEGIRRDLLELALVHADWQVERAGGSESARRTALAILDEAEQLLGPGHVLYLERQYYATALGLKNVAERAAELARRNPPQTAWDYYAIGRLLLRQPPASVPAWGDTAHGLGGMILAGGRALAADTILERAVRLEPGGFWPNFVRGQSAYRLGRHAEAVNAFSVCIGAAPDEAACHFNRALARAALGQQTAALADFERAKRLDPSLGNREAAVWANLERSERMRAGGR